MATQLSKADRIRKLLHLSNAEIAKHIGCDDAYVRAVRQRTSESGNPIEPPTGKAWKKANPDRVKAYCRTALLRIMADPFRRERLIEKRNARFRERYHSDPEFREYHLSKCREWQRQRRAEARAS